MEDPRISRGSTNDQVTESECPTRLIEDVPAEDDLLAFHGDMGPHQRVAKAIVDLVLAPDEAGGKMIGLEGSWGAGKTTVINLIGKLLEGEEGTTVLTFDAWAHEGDPLRRTFLESLIRHFRSLEWVKKRWDKTLEELAKRRRVTNTRTVPKTTALGKWFSISVFLVPVGLPFLATALQQGVAIDPNRPIAWTFIIGLSLAIAPFIVLGGNWGRVRWKRWRKIDSADASDNDNDVSDWAFLAGDAITEIKQETTETPDPTSIEFEDVFSKLMRTALPAGSNKQAVIVLDNLDRVDPQDALSIWATLQTFLQHRGTETEHWFKKLWIVVPYDPSGLRRLWDGRRAEEDGDEVSGTDAGSATSTTVQDDGRIVSDSFIDKSFQLRFEVPPPVLSNWKEYLNDLVEHALPKHSQEDRHTIYRVLNRCRTSVDEGPSPRELKLYVNQIGAIHRQWQHKFDIGHVAYYVILRRMNVDVRKQLLTRTIPDPGIEAFLPANLRENLAGLAFNVKADVGVQFLLSDPVYEFLSKNNVQGLREYEQLYKDGFWSVLEDVVTSRLTDSDATSVANASLCLEAAEILKEQNRSEVRTIVRGVGWVAASVKRWTPLNDDLASGIVAACRLASDPVVSSQIVVNLQQTIAQPAEKKEGYTVTATEIKALVLVCTELRELRHEDAVSAPFTLPLDADGWLDVCIAISKHEPSLWPMFEPQGDFADISEGLCTAVTDGRFTSDKLAALHVTQAAPIDSNWDTLAQAFERRLDAGQNPDSKEANLLLNGLSLLRQFDCTEAEAASKRLADGGHITHNLHGAQSQNNVECKARCLVAFLEQRPETEKPQNVGQSEAGYTALSSLLDTDDAALGDIIVDTLSGQGNQGLLFEVVDAREQYDPLIVRCLRVVADGDTPEILFETAVILERWPDLAEHLDEESPNDERFHKLVRHLCEQSSLIEKVQEPGFQYEDAELYITLARASSSSTFLEWCRDGLQALDAATWKSELDEEGYALDLLLEIVDSGTVIELRQAFQDAVVQHANGVLTGNTQSSDELVSQRSNVVGALGTAARAVLRDRLLDAAIDTDGGCADRFFDLYGDEISNVTTLTKNKAVVSGLFSPLVREKSVGGLRWLNSVLSNEPKLLDKFKDKAATKDFRQRLEGEPAAEEGEAHDLIAEIANTLGIGLAEEPAEEKAAPEAATLEDKESDDKNPEKK